VGPFSKLPEYEKFIIEHLKKVNGIFARESVTVKYLDEKEVTKNVCQVADPAFLMEAIQPSEENFKAEIPKGAIGINLSPLLARYVTNGDLKMWIPCAANIVKEVTNQTKRPIYLIPHVTNPYSNDYEFLKNILSLLGKTKERIELIPPKLNAAETKWIIGQMLVFAGARTHSTIAAISSGVPTLSFAYSIKAKGINEDVFGNACFCVWPNKLIPELVAERIVELIQESEKIKSQLNVVLPSIRASAMNGGKYLKEILDTS
jgi:polysaccharide pyruvyl transferase WcaK-like protein